MDTEELREKQVELAQRESALAKREEALDVRVEVDANAATGTMCLQVLVAKRAQGLDQRERAMDGWERQHAAVLAQVRVNLKATSDGWMPGCSAGGA